MKKRMMRLLAAFLILFLLLILFLWFWGYIHEDNIRKADMNAPYHDSSLSPDERAHDLLSRMSLEEKIGQMVMVDKRMVSPGDIKRYKIGSLLSGGGANPEENNAEGWLNMVLGLKKEGDQDLGIPLFYAVDAVHGHNNVIGATIFPHNIGLGATLDPELVEKIGRATAEELKATGVYWNFAPNLDIPRDYSWGRTYEGFGEDVEMVSDMGAAYIRGLQGTTKGKIDVLATAKHFVGGGAGLRIDETDGKVKIDQGEIGITEEQLRNEDLVPFEAAIKEGALSVMVTHFTYGERKMSVNKYWMTDVLKGEMGYKGFIVSDWEAINDISPNYFQNVVDSINAGMDMAMAPYHYADFVREMKAGINQGEIPMERVDDAVFRILRTKFILGLFDREPSEGPTDVVGSEEHRALAREAVRKSIVLLEDKASLFPLPKKGATYLVAGRGADNIGMQSGGWTVSWQGGQGDTTEGTTIIEAIKAELDPKTKITFDAGGTFNGMTDMADIGIAVVGEDPYAEGAGDKESWTLNASDKALIKRLREKSKRLIVVLLTGRPLLTTEEEELADSIVVAWLPGTEGAGVTDVLFGDYPFTGELPFAWPVR
jgi:beta-glucosidase